jgi:hypothetical protein
LTPEVQHCHFLQKQDSTVYLLSCSAWLSSKPEMLRSSVGSKSCLELLLQRSWGFVCVGFPTFAVEGSGHGASHSTVCVQTVVSSVRAKTI